MTNLSQKKSPIKRGEKNNWKGGRSVASNGYILIRVGCSHPLADVRGYAYEHRLVVSEKIGRLITPEEQVHHINGNKADNRPENLEVLSFAEHRVMHRKKEDNLRRLPNELNELIQCACGCGKAFLKFDESGRPRHYISGHNGKKIEIDKILDFIGERAVTVKEISDAFGWHIMSINKLMSKLQQEQKITKFRRSKYCQSKYAHIHLANPLIECDCGCGEQLTKYDIYGRIRRYKPGHGFKKIKSKKGEQ